MKKSFLKTLILLNLSLVLTSCNINFEINLSGNSSSTSLNESTKIGTVKVKEAIIPVSNEAFEFDNASCNISSTGFVIQEGSSSYILGGGSNPGSLEFEFPENTSLNRIEILGYAYENDSFSCNVSINDEEKEVTYYKTNTTFLDFENSEIVKSFSIKSNGVGSRIKFYGIKLYYNDIVPVTGINIVKDLEVEVNKKVSVSSYYEVLPSNATNKKVELSCSSDFVSIESEFIKCLKEGEYDISIKTVDGDFKATLHVTATSSTLQEGIRKLTREEIAFDYDEIFSPSHYEGLIPSRGNPNIIVVPVNFSDLKSVYDFNANDNLNRLNAAFNGSNYDHTNSYSHSLRSFYKASSYGALDMEFIISDVFTPSFTSSSFINKESRVDGGGTYKLLEEIYNSATIDGKKINFNDTKYDLNKDGFVDGIWLIYNDDRELTSSSYWPYTYWYYNIDDEGYILSGGPNISCYANCSVYFTYEDSSTGEDYHTLVHETGHMLGLDDYYITTSTSTMSAIGGLDMMDYNIGDHNAFSKFALNWIEPYIVESPTSITLSPFQDNGDALIIPSSYFNDSAFSEYLIIF